jgi:hypothetical protein
MSLSATAPSTAKRTKKSISFFGIASSLAAVHSQSAIRDLNPDNNFGITRRG